MKKKLMVICTCGMVSALVACGEKSDSVSETTSVNTSEIVSSSLADKDEEVTTNVDQKLTNEDESRTENESVTEEDTTSEKVTTTEEETTSEKETTTEKETTIERETTTERETSTEKETTTEEETTIVEKVDSVVKKMKHYAGYNLYTCTEYNYDAHEKVITKNTYEDGILSDNTVYTYDEDGKLIQDVYKFNGTTKKNVYYYSANGELSEIIKYWDGYVSSKVEYTDKENNKLVCVYDYVETYVATYEFVKVEESIYDNKGFLLKCTLYSQMGNFGEECLYEYNEFGDVIKKTINFGGGGSEIEEYSYDYDKYGNKEKCIMIDSYYNWEGELEREPSKYEYIYENIYDENNRLTKCTIYENGKDGKEIDEIFEYEYYDKK